MIKNTLISTFLISCYLFSCFALGNPSDTLQSNATQKVIIQKTAKQKSVKQQEGLWDLTDIYPNLAAWEAERVDVKQQLGTLKTCQGKLGDSGKQLAQCLNKQSNMYRKLLRLYTHSMLNKDTDLKSSARRERHALLENLMTAYEEASSFIEPELLKVGEKRIQQFLSEEPSLSPYRFSLLNTLRKAPHILTKKEERLLAAASAPLSTAAETYSILTNAEIPWPMLSLEGNSEHKENTDNTVILNPAAYTFHRSSTSRVLRKQVFDTFFGTYQNFAQTLAVTLEGQIKAHVFEANARTYDSALAQALSTDNIPHQVYLTLVETVNKNLGTLHRYLNLRAKLMGIETLHYYDVYPAITRLDKKYSLEDSQALLTRALEPLGEEYQALQRQAARKNWVHAYPKEGKRSGAYMMGAAYDVHPYILLNHHNNFNALTTYAHEWGHGMHSLLANQAQPFVSAGYATFIAEIASTSHEVLLLDYLQKNARNKEEKLFYLLEELQSLRGTFFRQTQFAEFELAAHQLVERGEALSAKRLNTLYGDLLKRYYGHEEGSIFIDDIYTVEWAYIPHFYRNFYVYQYATSISAAYYLMEKVRNGGEQEREGYLTLLKAGGSDYPYTLLKKAGVDMATPDVYQALIRRFEHLVKEVIALSDL